ncbi:MAG TPA: hypothetical protein VF578_13100 [Methylomirabilota bacterium]
MIKHFDHVTVVVRDVEAAKQFFGLLGFKEDKSVVIKGSTTTRMRSPTRPLPTSPGWGSTTSASPSTTWRPRWPG